MVIRHLDGVRVEVVRTRDKRAHDEPWPFERLMHGRRLMEAADDRLENGDVEPPWVESAAPAPHVEGMMPVDVASQPRSAADEHADILAIDLQQLGRMTQI